MCIGVVLFGGQGVPLGGLGRVVRDALSEVIVGSDSELCVGVSLFCGLAVILQRGRLVPWDTGSFLQADCLVVLRVRVIVIGRPLQPGRRLAGILFHTFSFKISEAKLVLGIGASPVRLDCQIKDFAMEVSEEKLRVDGADFLLVVDSACHDRLQLALCAGTCGRVLQGCGEMAVCPLE